MKREDKSIRLVDMYDEIYQVAKEGAEKPEDDQCMLDEIWKVLMDMNCRPNQQTRLMSYTILSESKPHRSHGSGAGRMIAFMPFQNEEFSKDFACRRFIRSQQDILLWYAREYRQPIESLVLSTKRDGGSNPVSGWENTYVYVEVKGKSGIGGASKLIGVADGHLPVHPQPDTQRAEQQGLAAGLFSYP